MNKTRSYPRSIVCGGAMIEFRYMTAADEAAVLDFAQKLPVHDLLFLPRDISLEFAYSLTRRLGLSKLQYTRGSFPD